MLHNNKKVHGSVYEGIASEHPDIADQNEFRKRADDVLANRRRKRQVVSDPKQKRAVDFFKNSIIQKNKVNEDHMSIKDKKREAGLKKKYDPSGMKASMIKQYGPEKGKQVYFATIRKQAMGESLNLDEAKISRAERKIRNATKKPRGSAVHAYDMDETLVGHDHSKVKVHVNDPSGKRVESLTNQQFNTHKLPKGHSYDFSEFRSSKIFNQSATPNKSMIKKLKKHVRQGKDVHIITARADMDSQPEFAKHLRRHGIEIDPQKGRKHVHVHRAGNLEGGDIGEKKVKILHGIMAKSGATQGHMYDDAAKVHKAMEKANRANPSGPQIKTHLVTPNKRGKVMSRSYQAVKESFNQWVSELLDEGYDLSEYTWDELYEGYVEILDEAATAVAAPSDEPKRPSKKFGPNKILYVSPYKTKPKKEYPKESVEVTPYEFWKSFIGDDEQIVESEEVASDEVPIEEKKITAYDYWKTFLEEEFNNKTN